MTIEDFKATLRNEAEPEGLSPALRAMWETARGKWDAAHQIAQDIDDKTGAWIHAYLHRKEGDGWNADYWDRRSGTKYRRPTLEAE